MPKIASKIIILSLIYSRTVFELVVPILNRILNKVELVIVYVYMLNALAIKQSTVLDTLVPNPVLLCMSIM